MISLLAIVGIFLFSKKVTNQLFTLLHRLTHHKKISIYLIALLYFPGTVLHEVSHFITAAALMLPVRDLILIPEVSDSGVRLGSVTYVRRDPFRGIIVGIAPFFAGLFFFYVLSTRDIATIPLLAKIAIGYLIFAVSSTMFSSKQDLKDLLFLIPLLILIVFLLYIFNIDLTAYITHQTLLSPLSSFLRNINVFLLLSGMINVILYITLRIVNNTSR